MGSEWQTCSLKEAGVQLIDCDHKTPKAQESGFPYIGIPQMKEGNIDFDANPRLISHSDLVTWTKKAKPQTNDVILSRRCNSGETVHVASRTEFALGQNLVILRSVGERVFPPYLRWVVRSPQWWAEVGKYLNPGAIFESLKCADIPKFEVPVPPLPEQKAIAHILCTLDDKIELNRRMNATLEGMGQALFKSWFVDFDPVIDNALAAGNPIPDELAPRAEVRRQALANGTANREAAKPFPAAFQETESMGWIPEGWEVKQIGQILRSVSDTYPLKTVDEVIFLNTGDILDGRFLHEDFSGTDGLPGQAKKSIRKDDILYSEIRPKNRRFAYVYFEGAQYVVSTKLMVLRPISDISSMFTYLILKQDSTIDHLQMLAESRSGTFPQITFDILSKIEVALPKEGGLVKAFTEKILQPTFEKQLKTDAATETLTKLRDTLLPKLISGELSTPISGV